MGTQGKANSWTQSCCQHSKMEILLTFRKMLGCGGIGGDCIECCYSRRVEKTLNPDSEAQPRIPGEKKLAESREKAGRGVGVRTGAQAGWAGSKESSGLAWCQRGRWGLTVRGQSRMSTLLSTPAWQRQGHHGKESKWERGGRRVRD